MGVYPREVEELEARVEASGWQLSLGEDSDQVGWEAGGQEEGRIGRRKDGKKGGREDGRT